jgi:hypothetical protein
LGIIFNFKETKAMNKIFGIFLLVNSALLSSAQVSLQSGSAIFSLPLFKWQDSKSRLNLNMSVDYNSGNGLVVDEVASNLGQGWNLNAGGVITRMQVGQPDDQPISPRGPEDYYSDITKYAPGYLFNSNFTNITEGCPIALTAFPLFTSANNVYRNSVFTDADREQDYFSFQFNGRTGMFVLGPYIQATGNQGLVVGDSKLKITYDINPTLAQNQNIRTAIYAFHIEDENGLTYTFQNLELIKMLRVHFGSATPDANGYPVFTVQPTGGSFYAGEIYNQFGNDELSPNENPYVVGSWYLSSITDSLTMRQVTFSYNMENLHLYGGKIINAVEAQPLTKTLLSPPGANSYIILNHNISITQTPILSQISFPDGNTVNLNYGGSRADLQGDKVLSSVSTRYMGTLVSQFNFNQSYFIGNQIRQPASSAENSLARLCLLSIQKYGVNYKDEEPPYTFNYYTGTNATEDFVPAPFSDCKDIWGYFNGNNNGVSMTNAIQRPYSDYVLLSYTDPSKAAKPFTNYTYTAPARIKAGYAQNGLLQKITYPGGGSLTYYYAQNTGTFPGGALDVLCGGVHVYQTILHDGSNSNASDIRTTFSYILSSGNSSIWGIENPVNMQLNTYSTTQANGSAYKYPGIFSAEEGSSIIDVSLLASEFSYIYSALEFGSALTSLVTTYFYLLPIFVVAVAIYEAFFAKPDPSVLTQKSYNYYNIDLNSKNRLPIQFKRVITSAYQNNGTQNGYSIYEFTSPDDFPLLVENNSASFSAKQRALPWQYGLPKLVTNFDADGNMVSQTQNNYDPTPLTNQRPVSNTGPASGQSFTCYVSSQMSFWLSSWEDLSKPIPSNYTTQSYTGPTNILVRIPGGKMFVDPYSIYTGRTPLIDSYDRSYNGNTNYLETHTHYDYSPNNYQVQKITTTLSNGDQQVKEIYYTADYETSDILYTLSQHNLVNLPVATYHSVIKSGTSTPTYLGASVSEFSMLPNGDIKPSQILEGRSSQPIGSYTVDFTNPLNYPNLITKETYRYSISGNLIKSQDEGGRVNAMIYDYNDRFVVANVLNDDIDINGIAYTSFETLSLGGWTINGTPDYNTTTAITGTQGFNLSSVNSISTTIPINVPYVLSFWSTNGSLSVSGSASLGKTGPTINGFTYYEYNISSGSASPSISSGDGSVIDELRLFPATSRMVTTTYNPILGKTADCDANNRITYYCYDNMGRLRLVKDEYGNFKKVIEYNFKQ